MLDGYADLSKNSDSYISKEKIEAYEKIIKKAKDQRNGIWKK